MTVQTIEAGVDHRTAGERMHAIWEGLGETAVGLGPQRELEATMAAILLANDPTVEISGITIHDLHVVMPSSIDVATGEQL